jgi:NRPS condensation-like uncharacterized protein
MSVVPALPDVLHADLQDQILRICTELGCAGPMIMMMSFAGRLDEARLARAVRLMLDAEPILGFRFESHPIRPVWRRRDDLDSRGWCIVHEVEDPEALVRSLLTPRPEHLEQNFLVHLARHPGGDTVLIWMSHLIADGFATSQCASLLAMIYSRLAAEPDYQPERNIAPRDSQQWMADLTFRDMLRIIRRDVVDALQARGPVHGLNRDYETFRATPPADADFARHRIPAPVVTAMDRVAVTHGCTRNDLLSAAFIRAFADFAWQGPAAKARVGLTVDLRSYAPVRRRHATYSMVGITYVSVGPDLGATFNDTLALVTAVTRRQKKALMGAANPLYVRFLTRMSFRRKRAMVEQILRRTMRRPMPPTFSNGGRLNSAKLRFDGIAPADAGFVVYPCPLPLFLVGAMEYEGAVTLTACFQPAELSRERVQMLLQRVQREIPTDLAAAEAAFVVKEIA